MTYGTLAVVRNEIGISVIIKADPEVEMAISRLIPYHSTDPLRVVAHVENTRLLRMVTSEYPLDVKTPEAWNALLEDITTEQKRIKELQTLEPVRPAKQYFRGSLLPFQQMGLDFMLKTGGHALLADEMGLGKTVQALAFVAKKRDSIPIVVVAPLVTLQNWKREIEKFLRLPVPGLPGRRMKKPGIQIIRSGKQSLEPAEFYLINYEMVDRRIDDLLVLNPKALIFDEIQSIRHDNTIKYYSCNVLARHHTIRYRLGLSGTPIYNRGIEMYGIASILKPGILGDRGEFIRRYCNSHDLNKTDADRRKLLSRTLSERIMLRRRKADVLPDLPEKSRIQQDIPINTAMYQKELKRLYKKIRTAKQDLEGRTGSDEVKQGLFELNKQVREMRIAERQIAGLAKTPHVIRYVTSLLEDYEDEKFVIFCHHRGVHQVLYDGLWHARPVQIIGGQSDKERQDSIDRFQNNDRCRVIICGLRAGNVGINLTSAAYVIFAELDWSPAVHRQAEDRLHRIGQKRNVFSHYLSGIGTFDEVLAGVLTSKTVEAAGILGDKMERLNNKRAIQMLEERFNVSGDLAGKISGA